MFTVKNFEEVLWNCHKHWLMRCIFNVHCLLFWCGSTNHFFGIFMFCKIKAQNLFAPKTLQRSGHHSQICSKVVSCAFVGCHHKPSVMCCCCIIEAIVINWRRLESFTDATMSLFAAFVLSLSADFLFLFRIKM